MLLYECMAGVAQLVRAPDCGSGGRQFDSDYSPHSQVCRFSSVGRATDL